jgi:glycosyltransferase involved in cell wall biosynthesis
MDNFSVVIVCRNEAGILGKTLQSLQGLSSDILVFDNGSTDDTLDIARNAGARVIEGTWEGFGPTKRKAANLALHDWILSLDADEAVDEELATSLRNLQPETENIVYEVNFRNYIGSKPLRFGEWGSDRHRRLFNRKLVNWDDAVVHEQLSMPSGVTIRNIKGHVLHYTVRDMDDYAKKMTSYAMLNADKYYRQGKKAGWLLPRVAPAFSFIKYYLFRLGFLDGEAGYNCAKMTAYYTYLKYARLRELNKAGD